MRSAVGTKFGLAGCKCFSAERACCRRILNFILIVFHGIKGMVVRKRGIKSMIKILDFFLNPFCNYRRNIRSFVVAWYPIFSCNMSVVIKIQCKIPSGDSTLWLYCSVNNGAIGWQPDKTLDTFSSAVNRCVKICLRNAIFKKAKSIFSAIFFGCLFLILFFWIFSWRIINISL